MALWRAESTRFLFCLLSFCTCGHPLPPRCAFLRISLTSLKAVPVLHALRPAPEISAVSAGRPYSITSAAPAATLRTPYSHFELKLRIHAKNSIS